MDGRTTWYKNHLRQWETRAERHGLATGNDDGVTGLKQQMRQATCAKAAETGRNERLCMHRSAARSLKWCNSAVGMNRFPLGGCTRTGIDRHLIVVSYALLAALLYVPRGVQLGWQLYG